MLPVANEKLMADCIFSALIKHPLQNYEQRTGIKWAITILLTCLLLLPTGCGAGQPAPQNREAPYTSDTPPSGCLLCGGGIRDRLPSCWGQDNIALISLNTFELMPVEINRYDRLDGHLIQECTGTVSLGGGKSGSGGFAASWMLECDRGYAAGTVDFLGDETLDTDRASAFLCSSCMNRILPRETKQCFGVGAIHLATEEIRLFEASLGGFTLGDYYLDCHLKEREQDGARQMDLLAVYCPVRYEKAP